LVFGGGTEPFTNAAAGSGCAAITLPASAKDVGRVLYNHCRRLANPSLDLTAGKLALGRSESATDDLAAKPERSNTCNHGAIVMPL